jgi:hypothetical protein
MLRRILLLGFCLGCVVSISASGRFTPRLIADGMLSFAFVPASELAGFAVSRRLIAARGGFAGDAERFLRGNWPWFVWMLAICAFAAVTRPDANFNTFNLLILGAALPIVASVWIDFRFFRDDRRSGRGRAMAAVFVQRAVAWPIAAFYFLGFAVPPRQIAHTFVELGELLSRSIQLVWS